MAVTITGHPAEYMPGWDVGKTLTGHGLQVTEAQGEDVEALYAAVRNSVVWDGPTAVIAKRPMAPGIEGAEGTSHGHDALAVPKAIAYFEKKGNAKAVEALKADTKTKDPHGEYLGCVSVSRHLLPLQSRHWRCRPIPILVFPRRSALRSCRGSVSRRALRA